MALTPGRGSDRMKSSAAIGAGGMGEVYRATRHEARSRRRDQGAARVLRAAIRTASRGFSAKPKTLAALNHPNIAAIYGLEKTPASTALVMELVEGEDLSR